MRPTVIPQRQFDNVDMCQCGCPSTQVDMGVWMAFPVMFFCTMDCMSAFVRDSANRCRHHVQVWNGSGWQQCQGRNGVVQCPRCEFDDGHSRVWNGVQV